jgi:hypothetical protein
MIGQSTTSGNKENNKNAQNLNNGKDFKKFTGIIKIYKGRYLK